MKGLEVQAVSQPWSPVAATCKHLAASTPSDQQAFDIFTILDDEIALQ